MQHIRTLDNVQLPPAWVTIGAYDGIHLGHQALVNALVENAHQSGEPAVVISLFPHPALVMGRTTPPYYLSSPEDRAELLEAMGVDILVTYPFSVATSNLTPQQFIQSISGSIMIRQLWVGDDFALGKDRQGTLDVLQQLGLQFGYVLHPFPQLKIDGIVVSSSNIRERLNAGDLSQVENMLGRKYIVRGRLKSIPSSSSPAFSTYSVQTWQEQLLPPLGDYACTLWVDGQDFPSIASLIKQDSFTNSLVKLSVLNLDCSLPNPIARIEFLQTIA